MGQVVSISPNHIQAIEGAEIPTLRVSGTVGVDFSGASLADAVVDYAGAFGEVRVILDSFGGFASDAFAFYDTIRAEGVRLHVDGRGTVASAATIIMAAAGRKRSRLYPNAEYLIHNATGGDAEGVERANDKMEAIYVELSGMSKAEVRKIMKADKPMSAQDAKRMGFVGAIVELQKLAAHADKNTTMEDKNKTKRVFAVDRDKALAAMVTGHIEIDVTAEDAELKTQLDSAVNDLKAERQKVADLEASAKTQPDAVKAAVDAAEAALKAAHAEDLKKVAAESDKLTAKITELEAKIKATPAAPAVKPTGGGAEANADVPLSERYPKLTAEQRAAAFDKVRAEAKAQTTTK